MVFFFYCISPVGTGREYNIHHVLLLNLFVIYAMTNVSEVIRCESGNWSSVIFILSVTFSVSVFEAYIANTRECITSIGAMGWNVRQWDSISITVYHYQC